MHLKYFIVLILICVVIQACGKSSLPSTKLNYEHDQVKTIKTIDGNDLTFIFDRPLDDLKHPILLVVDGSGCLGWKHTGLNTLFQPSHDASHIYSKVFVEKRGVSPDANNPKLCSEDFLRHYSIDQRVFDHLRVLQHLSKHAEWWNGELYIWGWSDGGDIAAQLTSYYPNVTKAVLGAMGGGYTMEEHFKNYWICAPNYFSGDGAEQERTKCINELSERFEDMLDNPTWKKSWSGADNSWKVWSTRLFSRLTHLLKDNTTPVLIVHGAEDINSTPVDSARRLIKELQDAENEAFTYWEIPNMQHSMSSLPDDKNTLLEKAMLNWLFSTSLEKQPIPENLR